jgi:hypothetical protein
MTRTSESAAPRIGMFWIAHEDAGRPGMVYDDGRSIQLVYTYDERGDERLHRMTLGHSIRWGDDPDYKNHGYAFPDVVWFRDAHGDLCLVDPRGTSGSLVGSILEGRVTFRLLLETGDEGISYNRINALRSRIEGLEEWMPIGSVSHQRVADDRQEATDVIRLRRQPEVRFGRALNAILRPSYRFNISPVPGQSLIEDEVHVETSARHARDWQDHLQLHQAVRDLVVVAGWRPYGMWKLQARRSDDPVRALARNPLGERWAPVTTYDIAGPTGEGGRSRFLFDFDDIGSRGLSRWVELRKAHGRGIAGMIHSIGITGMALETALSEAGAALEHIGFRLAASGGDSPGRVFRLHLRRVVAQVAADLRFDRDEWIDRLAAVYRSVKHADNPEPDTLSLLNTLRESRLVFRGWVASRIGVSRKAIERNLGVIPMSRPYERI